MQIQGTSGVQTATPVSYSSKVQSVETGNAVRFDTTDQIEISSEAQRLAAMNDISSVRAERIAEIRQQIETGRYETADKLGVTVERLLDELA